MNTSTNFSKTLGAAFLFQAILSAVGILLLKDPLIVSGDIIATMSNISNNVLQMRLSILTIMFTAAGVVLLGALLYITLKKQNRIVALIALCFYILEASILAVSRLASFSLIGISLESVQRGHPLYLQTLGNLFYEAAEFGDWLHMLIFTIGASLFYYLLFKSKLIPSSLSLFGFLAVLLGFTGTLFVLLGCKVPLIVFLPSLPFELGIGIWLIVKGFNNDSHLFI
jgi:uncharacterized protein DUF4386